MIVQNVSGTSPASRDALFSWCEKVEHVDQGTEDQIGDAPQVCGTAPEPLPPVRSSSRFLSQVWNLSDLLPGPGQPRPDSWSQEGELVVSRPPSVHLPRGLRLAGHCPHKNVKNPGRSGPAQTRITVCMSRPDAPTWPYSTRIPVQLPRDSARYPRRFRKASPP